MIKWIIINLADSESLKSKIKITGSTSVDGNTKNVEITIPFKYFSNFCGTREMPLINCEINLILTQLSTCIITDSTSARTFAITDAKLY